MEQYTQNKIPVEWRRYADQVIRNLKVGREIRSKIREDLYESLDVRRQMGDEGKPEELLGNPRDVALEFAENLNIGMESVRNVNEYRSKTEIFGIPLVHIVRNNYVLGQGSRRMVAKGIIAVGPVAIGVLAWGGIAFGLLTFAGIGIGLLGVFGGVAIGGLTSIGGVSISYFVAVGGLCIAHDFALGGLAIAKHAAIGGHAIALIAGFEEPTATLTGWSKYAFVLPEQRSLFIQAVNQELGGMAEWIKQFILFIAGVGV
ncbi:MAG: hypothetical protein Q4A41_02295 [Bacillota bacterium]|nr:hypothetical protein [Bacillota bacterium]